MGVLLWKGKSVNVSSMLYDKQSLLQCFLQRGCCHEYNCEYKEAKNCYDSALAINPSHIKSMQSLGSVLLCQEQHEMAEKVLRDAVNIDPTAHMSWWA